MAENIDGNSTMSNTRISTPVPKADVTDATASADALARADTDERKSLQDTQITAASKDVVSMSEKTPMLDESILLTGRKLVLAHTGFLL
jgi:hypothetical protein